MRTLFATTCALFVVACGTAGSSDGTETVNTELRQGDLRSVRTTGAPSCVGWACAYGTVPVSADDVFAIAEKYELQGSGTTGNPGSVRLAAIECVEIVNACEISCSVTTTCGGGGYVTREEATLLRSWLQSAPTESVGWATRASVTGVVCERAPGAPTRCRFDGDPAGGTPARTAVKLAR